MDNDVVTAATEKKMGIHASATCALNFGEKGNCIGYLLGKENQGMRIMFNMMNEARLAVGVQGLAQASAAYMYALRYAKETTPGLGNHLYERSRMLPKSRLSSIRIFAEC